MTIKLKLTAVDYIVDEDVVNALGEVIGTVERDLSAEGRVMVHVQYYNDTAPAVILFENDFTFGAKAFTEAEALDELRAVGRRVRDTRIQAATLSSYIGTEFDLDA